MSAPESAGASPLNDAQKRSILFTFLDLHRRMAEMEAMLAPLPPPSAAFSQYVNDLSPTEAKVVRDYFERVRARMLAALQEAGIPLDFRRTSVRWALQCGMTFLHVSLAGIRPRELSGYGPLDERGEAAVVRLQQELNRLIDRVAAYLRQGLGHDLAGRLARLESSPADVGTLTTLDRIITRRGLVEFRPLLEQTVRRLEAPRFEVAVFGRVSSGKSSLLNRIAGSDVLPVGVTPVTAVPTRLARGDRPAALIRFAEGEARTVGVEDLRQYASEEGNPGNRRHVTGILVQVPSPRLREGVVLVDTPGTGSLALSGSAETFAYLPHCDLGIALIDAASALTPDDLNLLRLLYEAGVPAQVVLSKADLLTPADRQRTMDYAREQLRRELGLDLPVHPVSTVGADEALLTRWFAEEIEPLLAQHRALAEASLRRKTAHLRESVLAVLQTLQARGQGGAGGPRVDGAGVRRLLEEADAATRQAQDRARDWTADVPALLGVVLRDAAKGVVSAGEGEAAPADVLQRVLLQRNQMAHDLVAGLQRSLGRTLESVQQALPLAEPSSTVRDLAFRGLPAPDLSALRPRLKASRPWCAALLPDVAAWLTRRDLQGRLGPEIREQLALHDRQLQAWLRASLGQLIEAYEAQAEVYREHLRRLTDQGPSGGAESPSDRQSLEEDLRALRQTEEAPPATPPGGEPGGAETGRGDANDPTRLGIG